MNILAILTYFLMIGFTFLFVYQVYLLKKKYKIKFLNNFYNYIALFYGYGFITLTSKIIFLQLKIINVHMLNIIVTAILLPLMITSIYYLFLWIGELINLPAKKNTMVFFWIIQVIAFSSFFYVSLEIADHKQGKELIIILLGFIILETLLLIYIISALIFKTKNIKDKKISKFSIILGIQYLILYPGIMILIEFIKLPFLLFKNEINAYYFLTFTVFLVNTPPVFYIKYFLKKNHNLFSQHFSDLQIDNNLFGKFNINEREKKIIDLIIRGNTNEEIGDIIFYSTKTIKNNITYIYKKFEVKNRVELVSLILSETNKNQTGSFNS